jgi:hypothetical protein
MIDDVRDFETLNHNIAWHFILPRVSGGDSIFLFVDVSGKACLGLGLYLARHIVERHGGTIKVGAGRTQGACFVYWLPIESSR